jgi:hypothetical protein
MHLLVIPKHWTKCTVQKSKFVSNFSAPTVLHWNCHVHFFCSLYVLHNPAETAKNFLCSIIHSKVYLTKKCSQDKKLKKMENLEKELICAHKTHTEHSPWFSWAVDKINYAAPKTVISKNVRMSIIIMQKLRKWTLNTQQNSNCVLNYHQGSEGNGTYCTKADHPIIHNTYDIHFQ